MKKKYRIENNNEIVELNSQSEYKKFKNQYNSYVFTQQEQINNIKMAKKDIINAEEKIPSYILLILERLDRIEETLKRHEEILLRHEEILMRHEERMNKHWGNEETTY